MSPVLVMTMTKGNRNQYRTLQNMSHFTTSGPNLKAGLLCSKNGSDRVMSCRFVETVPRNVPFGFVHPLRCGVMGLQHLVQGAWYLVVSCGILCNIR